MKSYDVQFVEDYKVLKSQYTRLKNTLEFWDNLLEKPNCPKDLLESQLDTLYNLIKIVETRADTEGIEL